MHPLVDRQVGNLVNLVTYKCLESWTCHIPVAYLAQGKLYTGHWSEVQVRNGVVTCAKGKNTKLIKLWHSYIHVNLLVTKVVINFGLLVTLG